MMASSSGRSIDAASAAASAASPSAIVEDCQRETGAAPGDVFTVVCCLCLSSVVWLG
eukprot:m.337948 g.337948  ORF g.337948 m.337948 type:complete len:57 (+) comp19809_c1_seq2:790-960(+)